jgi:hypothetical protein
VSYLGDCYWFGTVREFISSFLEIKLKEEEEFY